MKHFSSIGRNSSLGLSFVVAACVVALTPCQTSTAEARWGQSNNSRNSGPSPLIPRPGDIFNGATSRPEIALPTGNFGEVPSVRKIIPPGAAANAGAAIRNIQSGNPMGAFRAIGGAGQQGTSMIPAVGQIAGAVGAGRTGLPSGVSNIARTVQSGAQMVGGARQIQSSLGGFQQGGGSGLQDIAGMVGGAAGINQGLGGFSQGGSPNLNGILQGLGGGAASSMFGNGIGAGPFGQFMGQNNQLMQGMQFVALLQQIFGMFFGDGMPFNNANTGQSARTAFGNLMGANGGSSFPSFPQQFGVGMTAGVRGDFSNITAVDLEGFLPTNLKPYAQDFVDAGRAYQLDPRFLASISRVETGDGTSRAFLNGNNAMGISTSSGPVYGFGSVRDSIMRQSATLANPQGPYRGANTVQEIGSIYAPVGASNDFNGTNGGWASEVGGFYSRMRSA